MKMDYTAVDFKRCLSALRKQYGAYTVEGQGRTKVFVLGNQYTLKLRCVREENMHPSIQVWVVDNDKASPGVAYDEQPLEFLAFGDTMDAGYVLSVAQSFAS